MVLFWRKQTAQQLIPDLYVAVSHISLSETSSNQDNSKLESKNKGLTLLNIQLPSKVLRSGQIFTELGLMLIASAAGEL